MQTPIPDSRGSTRASTRAIDLALAPALGAASILSWLALGAATGEAEAWDTAAYFTVLLPGLLAAAALAGFFRPSRSWLWSSSIAVGQAAGLAITGSGSLSLGPVPLLFLGFVFAAGLAAAAAGSALGLRRARRAG